MTSSVLRQRIIAEARTWIGTPFHQRAGVRGVGVDCLGLIRATLRAVGVPWSPLADAYETLLLGQQWFRHMTREFLLEIFRSVPALRPIPLTAIQTGDMCLLVFTPGRPCSHAVFVSHPPPHLTIIHVWRVSQRKEVLEQRVPAALWERFRYAFTVQDALNDHSE